MGLRYLLIRRGSTKRQLNPGLHCNVKIEFCNDYQTFYINNVLSRESIEDDLTKQVYGFLRAIRSIVVCFSLSGVLQSECCACEGS